MDIENTAIRLKRIMEIKKLKQVDLLEIVKPYCEKYNVKMNKSDISQYLSGKTKPNQDKLVILSMALNVNEAWLMGYDVPVDRVNTVNKLDITQNELILLENYNKLNDLGKKEANKRVLELSYMPMYCDEISATKVIELNAEEDKPYLEPIAAHNDFANDEEQQRLMQEDLDEL